MKKIRRFRSHRIREKTCDELVIGFGGVLACGTWAHPLRFVAFGGLHCLSGFTIYSASHHSGQVLLSQDGG